MKKLIILLSAASLFAACSKNNSNNSRGPVISVSSPSDNQVFAAGQMVTIAAAITDQDNIQQTQIHVEDKSTSAIVLHQEAHPSSASSMVSGIFTTAAGVTYKVEVEAIDVAGNESKVELATTGK